MASVRSGSFLRNNIFPYWRTFVVFLTPISLIPLLLNGTQKATTGYVILTMSIYWMTEALPLAITSLMPMMAFPLLGIMDTNQVCRNYFTGTAMMFIGGLIVGLAVEFSNIHKRIALKVILLAGPDPKWLMVGFMSVTMFLSMWVSNTGATAMIAPIVDALIVQLYDQNNQIANEVLDVEKEASDAAIKLQMEEMRRLRVTLMLAVSYSANIGGTGTLIGSTPQLALKGIVEELYGPNTDLTFATWMAVNVPAMLINTVIIWLWMVLLLRRFKCQSQQPADREQARKVDAMLRRKYQDLGPMNFNESTVVVLFVILVNLWLFRDPKFVPGWGSLFSKQIGDAVPVLVIIFILFIMPAKLDFWCFRKANGDRAPKSGQAMLTWNYLHEKLPWGLVLLLGSGFAMSDASKVSGLSLWLGEQLAALQFFSHFTSLVIICFVTSWVTEVVSNTATANIILPILAQMAEKMQVNPLYFMIPVTATCGYCFVVPVGTPPNAIVYAAADMKPADMVKGGVVIKMVSVMVLCVVMETIGTTLFPIETSLLTLQQQHNVTASLTKT